MMDTPARASQLSSPASVLSAGLPAATPYAGASFGPLLSDTIEDFSVHGTKGDPLTDDIGLIASHSSSANGIASPQISIPRVAAHIVAQQIAASVAQSSAASTQIVLNPEELGFVRISLTTSDAGLVVNIVAERPETTDLLRRNIDSLMQEFASMGYDNPSFSFEGREGRTTDQSEQTSTEGLHSEGETAVAPAVQHRSRTASGGLDLKL